MCWASLSPIEVLLSLYDSSGHRTVPCVPPGFEYTYDSLSRIVEEKHLAENIKLCYTYDNLSRVTKRQIIELCCNEVIDEEDYTYDAAGNITNAPNSSFQYDVNNRLTNFEGHTVTYDMDGNLLSVGGGKFKYDSANRLTKAYCYEYAYNAEDVRIKNLSCDDETLYTYNTNCKLSQLLLKTTNGVVTKYVYGIGLIGEETEGNFKTYHFDYRGSTVAITDECGCITDTFKYDTYGNITERTGNSKVIFGYNGRDGVVTDENGLIYMRARYYSPKMRRFINADVIHGEISDSTSLNRYAYVNGNPVSFVDPFGLDAALDKYISSNYSGVKNISLVINSPNYGSRIVANVKDGKLNNGHAFIRFDDGAGNVKYIGFAPESNSVANMILGRNVKGKFLDDSKSDWNVAKVYKLSDKQYSYIKKYIDSLDLYEWNYNIETHNCTTFAVNTVQLQGAAAGNFMTVKKHNWKLPNDLTNQLENYKALPKLLPAGVAAWVIANTMGGFYGYTPADAAEDLKTAEGLVLLKPKDEIEAIENKTYIRSK